MSDDDKTLGREVVAHAAEVHPEDVRTPEEVAAHVAAEAEDAPDRPPWAY
ncbi:MAG TPA: hypothetical protein VEV43_13540 [Actinomycetota bacterium]|nr:hypothetical protein [Actinomycetota bacterium]